MASRQEDGRSPAAARNANQQNSVGRPTAAALQYFYVPMTWPPHRLSAMVHQLSAKITQLLAVVTHFGDLAILMPLVALTSVWLAARVSRVSAVWWLVAVGYCIGLTATVKVAFVGCPPITDLHSPSGHTSFSTLVYGAITWILARESTGLRRVLAVIMGSGLIIAIAASRTFLQAHSPREVYFGLAIGLISLCLFVQGWRRDPYIEIQPAGTARIGTPPVGMLVVGTLGLALLGWNLNHYPEPFLRTLSFLLSPYIGCR
jgi:membrane-associated phospholipid phosphatase